ncbi:FeoB small GTPase domain-containing protein, partial [Campylobacter lari]|uniref:FeoB small GTPase domain-containing protein n=1 Tax=Campylobacter lari TaxID=201 RepID=UPI001F093225
EIIVALVGQPNVGKILFINALCKAIMKVGIFSGVTVEKAEARLVYKNYEFKFIDLPGTYALDGYSEEEKRRVGKE